MFKSDYRTNSENSDDAFTFNINLWYEIIIQNAAFASNLTFTRRNKATFTVQHSQNALQK